MQVGEGRVFIGRFEFRKDLLESLTSFCRENGIRLGVLSVIGALTGARLGYYDQAAKKYVDCVDLKKKLEILATAIQLSKAPPTPNRVPGE